MNLLRISARQLNPSRQIQVARFLPVPGDIAVKVGQLIEAEDVIGQATRSGQLTPVNIAQGLGFGVVEDQVTWHKKVGEAVEPGERLASLKGLFPWAGRTCTAPVAGRLKGVNGCWALIESGVEVVAEKAMLAGRIGKIYANRGVLIDTVGTVLEPAGGIGGETYGLLQPVPDDLSVDLMAETVAMASERTILVVRGQVSEVALRRLDSSPVRAIIAGSFEAELLTLNPAAKIVLIATEGFGHHSMACETWEVLRSQSGKMTYVCGVLSVLQSSRSSKKPMIIVPSDEAAPASRESVSSTWGMVQVGSRVRAIGGMDGAWGVIATIPQQPLNGGAVVAHFGAEIQFPDDLQFVPWGNMEKIE